MEKRKECFSIFNMKKKTREQASNVVKHEVPEVMVSKRVKIIFSGIFFFVIIIF